MTADDAYDPRNDVRVSQPVVRSIEAMPPRIAADVARTILRIPKESGAPFPVEVPGDPPGTRYRVLVPDTEQTPVVIYRRPLEGEEGKWLVTSLMDRDAYRAYAGGLADNPYVQGVATAVATSGTVSASDIAARRGRG